MYTCKLPKMNQRVLLSMLLVLAIALLLYGWYSHVAVNTKCTRTSLVSRTGFDFYDFSRHWAP